MQASYPVHCARVLQTQAFHYTYGGSIYANKASQSERAVPLVMECRSIGLTDHQWCREKGICPGTFYGWVRRLRQKGYQDIPEPVHSQRVSTKQEIVRIEPDIPAQPDVSPPLLETAYPAFPVPAMELSVAGVVLRIPNGTDPALLGETVRLIGGGLC